MILSSLWPRQCFLCGAAHKASAALCPHCWSALPPPDHPACPRCGESGPLLGVCHCCRQLEPAFDETVAAFAYRYPVDVLVRRLKYGGALQLAPLLAAGLSQALAGRELPDLLVAMPLSLRRWRRRGYNQAHEIARRVAVHCGRPLQPVLERLRDTQAQAGLTAVRRRDNLIGAFRCRRPVTGLRVALVDDVMTSGATLDAAARALKAAGACRVSAWVAARTPAPES